MNTPKNILFVCTGNICRSPVCEAVCKEKTNGKVNVDSAAISWHHRDEAPDKRTQDICIKNGIDISGHRSRQIRWDDWILNDVIVALDNKIYETLQQMKPANSKAKLVLFSPPFGLHDPYFGGRTGFVKMFKDIDNGMLPFLEHIKAM